MGNELSDVSGGLYSEYEKLILQRDQARKEAGSIWTSYMKEFGELLTERFRLQVECIRMKKEIGYIMQAVNTGSGLDMDDMKESLDREMQTYRERLDSLMKDAEESLKARVSTKYTITKVRQLYRQIAKKIHPDICPAAADREDIRDLWQRTEKAYTGNDLKEMEELAVLVDRTLAGEHVQTLQLTPEDLKKKIEELKEEIDAIYSTDPYRYTDLLSDEGAVEDNKAVLKEEISNYTDYLQDLRKKAGDLLADSGISITMDIGDIRGESE